VRGARQSPVGRPARVRLRCGRRAVPDVPDVQPIGSTSATQSSGQWRDDDYDVLENGQVVGRIFKSPGAPQDRQWM
jgi:hypothetical protein